ncbi:hypothetical protein RRG08_046296 [Elysia crispata]|uniref:Uncharacterized protein n=1 Tax=Elysia crispata TaxID=231223 RepID=A0AAE0YLN6_9GAST|nr:hypothetical protein RRG08_046296 [Elysia crispata]
MPKTIVILRAAIHHRDVDQNKCLECWSTVMELFHSSCLRYQNTSAGINNWPCVTLINTTSANFRARETGDSGSHTWSSSRALTPEVCMVMINTTSANFRARETGDSGSHTWSSSRALTPEACTVMIIIMAKNFWAGCHGNDQHDRKPQGGQHRTGEMGDSNVWSRGRALALRLSR